VKERKLTKVGKEIMALIQQPTAKDKAVTTGFQTKGGSSVREFCQQATKENCLYSRRQEGYDGVCEKVHFRQVIHPHTDRKLGDCSYLNACRHMVTCKYVHYEIDPSDVGRMKEDSASQTGARKEREDQGPSARDQDRDYRSGYDNERRSRTGDRKESGEKSFDNRKDRESVDRRRDRSATKERVDGGKDRDGDGSKKEEAQKGLTSESKALDKPALNTNWTQKYNYPPQWVCCDVRKFNLEILGEFPVIMADPPWDIHMELPYGTLKDEEMLELHVDKLAKAGVIFLWVTGRAMELGRRCLTVWGYECVGELLWIKTNQLQRLIRTGRTGHWLNHSKEHCLIGLKGDPPVNHNVDCDVIVSEVRETSRKPDEIYGLLERLAPKARKLELFGRQHNTRPGWVTVGNQLDGVHLADPFMVDQWRTVYPNEEMVQIEVRSDSPTGGKSKEKTKEKASGETRSDGNLSATSSVNSLAEKIQ